MNPQNIIDTVTGGLSDLRYNWPGKWKRFRIHIIAYALFLTGLLQAVNPYVLQSLLPERYQSAILIGFSVLLWLNRKLQEKPVLVETTYYEESLAPDTASKPDGQ